MSKDYKWLDEILQKAFAYGLAVGKIENIQNETYEPLAEIKDLTALIDKEVRKARIDMWGTLIDTLKICLEPHRTETYKDRLEQWLKLAEKQRAQLTKETEEDNG